MTQNNSGSEKGIRQNENPDFQKINDIVGGINKPIPPNIDECWIEIEQRIDQTGNSNARYKAINWFVITTMTALFLMVTVLFYFSGYQQHLIAKDNTSEIALKDGSKIHLNKNSSIHLKRSFNIFKRQIKLAGEAYFIIKKSDKPFIVCTKEAKIEVTGTEFNTKSRHGLTQVGVNLGSVNFSSHTYKNSVICLTNNQYSECSLNSKPTPARKIVDKQFPDWIYGYILYENCNLKKVIADIEGLMNVKISVADEEILDLKVSGMLKGDTCDELLQVLTALTGKQYRKSDSMYEIY